MHVPADRELSDLTFDETYNVRDTIDFLTEKLAARDKLVQSSKQFSEKGGGPKFGTIVKRFEDLYTDFLRLYQPVIDRMSERRTAIQNDIDAKKDSLTAVMGMIQVAKGVEGVAERLRELEIEAKQIESSIGDKQVFIEKIDQLLNRTKHSSGEVTRRMSRDEQTNVFGQSDDFLSESADSTTKPARKAGNR